MAKLPIPKFEKAVNFEKYIKEKLTAKDYENLPEYLNTNGTWFRRLLDNPSLMTERQVRMFGKLLEVQPWELCVKYGLGAFKMKAIELLGFWHQAEAALQLEVDGRDPTSGNQPVEVELSKG